MSAPPPVPALPDTARLTTYAVAASAGPFNVGFALFGDSTDTTSWIQVFLGGVQQNSGWTLTSPSGSLSTIARPITDAQITFTAPITGALTIVSQQRPRRLAQNDENRGVSARDWNQAYTAIVAGLRELYDLKSRLPIIPPDSASTGGLLPAKSVRALQGLGFDASGNFIPISQAPAGIISAGMADVVAAPDHATALALLGGGSTLAIPFGMEAIWPGLTAAPNLWKFEDGSAIARATYPEVMAVLAPSLPCVITSGSDIIALSGGGVTTGFGTGWPVESAALSAGTTILNIIDSTHVRLNQPASNNGATAQFFIYGNGDGSTTFNLPLMENGQAIAGIDFALARLPGGNVINASLGEATHALTTAELAVHSHGVTDPGHSHTTGQTGTVNAGTNTVVGANSFPAGNGGTNTGSSFTGITINNAGSGTAHNNVQPTRVRRFIIYVGH